MGHGAFGHMITGVLQVGRTELLRVADVGVDVARAENGSAGAVGLQSLRIGVHQVVDAGLGSAVGAGTGTGHESAHGGGGGNPELSLMGIRLDHAGHKDQQAVDNMVQADAHDPVEIVKSRGFHGAEGVDAGSLDEQMGRAAEGLFHLISSSGILCTIGQIHFLSQNVFAGNTELDQFFNGIVQSFLTDVGNADLHAFAAKNLGLTQTGTGSAAGNEYDFAFKISHCDSPFSYLHFTRIIITKIKAKRKLLL